MLDRWVARSSLTVMPLAFLGLGVGGGGYLTATADVLSVANLAQVSQE